MYIFASVICMSNTFYQTSTNSNIFHRHGNNATLRVFSAKTKDCKPMVLKTLVDLHLSSIGS